MVPHAGYDYSGAVAAYAFKALQGRKVNTVVMICNSHQAYFDGAAIDDSDAWQTPLGQAAVDKKLADKLVVAGGGVAYIRAAPCLDNLKLEHDQQAGVDIVRKALVEPAKQIAINAGQDGGVIVDKIRSGKGNFGYNAATEEFEDLMKAGILDPTKVTRVALQNAASVAGLMITTECAIAEKPEEKKDMPQMPPGGGGMY